MSAFEMLAHQPLVLLTARQVAERLGVSVRTVWRMTARAELPPPIRYNRKLVRWRAADVDRYVAVKNCPSPRGGATL